MKFTIDDLKKEYSEKIENIKEIKDNKKRSEEELEKINDIIEIISKNGDLDEQIAKCDENIKELNSFNTNFNANSISIYEQVSNKNQIIDNKNKLVECKKYIVENANNGEAYLETLNRLEENCKNSIANQENEIKEQTELLDHLKRVCTQQLENIKNNNEQIESIKKQIKEKQSEIDDFFKIYKNFLTNEDIEKIKKLKQEKIDLESKLQDIKNDEKLLLTIKENQDYEAEINQIFEDIDKELNIIDNKENLKENEENEKTDEDSKENTELKNYEKDLLRILNEPFRIINEQRIHNANQEEVDDIFGEKEENKNIEIKPAPAEKRVIRKNNFEQEKDLLEIINKQEKNYYLVGLYESKTLTILNEEEYNKLPKSVVLDKEYFGEWVREKGVPSQAIRFNNLSEAKSFADSINIKLYNAYPKYFDEKELSNSIKYENMNYNDINYENIEYNNNYPNATDALVQEEDIFDEKNPKIDFNKDVIDYKQKQNNEQKNNNDQVYNLEEETNPFKRDYILERYNKKKKIVKKVKRKIARDEKAEHRAQTLNFLKQKIKNIFSNKKIEQTEEQTISKTK